MISFSRNKSKGSRASPGRRTEDFPSNTRFATALANLILIISSGWALRKLNNFEVTLQLPYEDIVSWSKIPFYLILIHATVCFVTFGNPVHGEKIRWLHVWTAVTCVLVGLPCFTLQLAFQHGILLQSLLPIVSGVGVAGLVYKSLWGDSQRWHNFVMNIIILTCLTTIGYISYIHHNYYGFSTVLAYCVNYFVIGRTGTAFNLPAIDLFTYGYVFCNYFAVKAILD